MCHDPEGRLATSSELSAIASTSEWSKAAIRVREMAWRNGRLARVGGDGAEKWACKYEDLRAVLALSTPSSFALATAQQEGGRILVAHGGFTPMGRNTEYTHTTKRYLAP